MTGLLAVTRVSPNFGSCGSTSGVLLPVCRSYFGVVTAGSGSESSDSLSESCMVNVRVDFINRPSGPRRPVPLLLGSCVSSEIGLLINFLCKTLLSAVVTVWLVPDTAIWILAENLSCVSSVAGPLNEYTFSLFFFQRVEI